LIINNNLDVEDEKNTIEGQNLKVVKFDDYLIKGYQTKIDFTKLQITEDSKRFSLLPKPL
jgi:hypothetical protein